MAYYYTCPKCGANLDPGEPCDCGKQSGWKEHTRQHIKEDDRGQYTFCFEKNRKLPYMYAVGRKSAR